MEVGFTVGKKMTLEVWFWGRLGPSGAVSARPGPARPGSARLGSARSGPARLGLSLAQPGLARLGSGPAWPHTRQSRSQTGPKQVPSKSVFFVYSPAKNIIFLMELRW